MGCLKRYVHKLAFSALCFAKKVINHLQSYQLFFVLFELLQLQICKTIRPKVMQEFVLASDIWLFDPKLTFFFAEIRIFKLLVVKYAFSKSLVLLHECLRC